MTFYYGSIVTTGQSRIVSERYRAISFEKLNSINYPSSCRRNFVTLVELKLEWHDLSRCWKKFGDCILYSHENAANRKKDKAEHPHTNLHNDTEQILVH